MGMLLAAIFGGLTYRWDKVGCRWGIAGNSSMGSTLRL